ncbi:MAG: hypothetical protein R3190_06945 [Thermoanaerobaculia bacterium]|nr:hypothetical protein [Thermoanaerobaculia bacterium]
MCLLLSGSAAALALVTGPDVAAAARGKLPHDLSPAESQRAEAILERITLVRIFTAPAAVCTRGLAAAALLWLLVHAAAGRTSYARALSLSFHLALLTHLEAWTIAAVGGLTGRSSAETSLALDALLEVRSPLVGAALSALSPFAPWALLLTVLGAREALGLSRGQSLVVGGGFWAVVLGFRILLSSLAATLAPA